MPRLAESALNFWKSMQAQKNSQQLAEKWRISVNFKINF